MAAAPGRVNLIGEHTDYNDGFVLPMGIERYTVLAAAPNDSRTIQLQSASNGGKATIDLERPIVPAEPSWANYVRGVLDGFIKRGQSIPGFDALIDSNVPIGGGLSSSAALEVATATLLEEVTGLTLEPVDKALLAQKAEQDFAGVPCGIMDQMTSALGRANALLALRCQPAEIKGFVELAPSIGFWGIDSGERHAVSGADYGAVRTAAFMGLRVLATEAGVPEDFLANLAPSEYEQSLVRSDDLSQVKRAFDLNGYVGILYLIVLAVSIYVS